MGESNIATADVRLRAPVTSDMPNLMRWRADSRAQLELMLRITHSDRDEAESWIARRTSDPHGDFRVVATMRDDRAVGFVQLTRIDASDASASLGLFVDESVRGTGAAIAALAAMESAARDRHHVRTLRLEVLAINVRALRFWEARGYRRVEVRAGSFQRADELYDVVFFEKRLTPPRTESLSTPIPNDPALIDAMEADAEIQSLRKRLFSLMGKYRYSYNWTWYDRPIIQLPSDVMAMQMLIFEHKPDLIIETGVAHGGSLVMYASLMEVLGEGKVLGIDIDIREHNRRALDAHPMRKRIELVQGSSIDPSIAAQAARMAANAKRVFVCLDSNHTADHVARELELYAPLVTKGLYLVVFDTAIEDMSAADFPDRPWGPGNSPKTAVHAFLKEHPEFSVDAELERRLLFTVAPEGYLRRAQ